MQLMLTVQHHAPINGPFELTHTYDAVPALPHALVPLVKFQVEARVARVAVLGLLLDSHHTHRAFAAVVVRLRVLAQPANQLAAFAEVGSEVFEAVGALQ